MIQKDPSLKIISCLVISSFTCASSFSNLLIEFTNIN